MHVSFSQKKSVYKQASTIYTKSHEPFRTNRKEQTNLGKLHIEIVTCFKVKIR